MIDCIRLFMTKRFGKREVPQNGSKRKCLWCESEQLSHFENIKLLLWFWNYRLQRFESCYAIDEKWQNESKTTLPKARFALIAHSFKNHADL
jgi:hypothetical protein